MNWGVPGWTTQESLVNYFINVQDYEPDIVIIHHAINDNSPRLFKPGTFRPDYAHWRKSWENYEVPWWDQTLIRYCTPYASYRIHKGADGFNVLDFVRRNENRLPRRSKLSDLAEKSGRIFRRNIVTIAEHATSKGARVFLVTMPYKQSLAQADPEGVVPLWAQLVMQHNQLLRDIAEEGGFGLIDQELMAMHDPPRSEEMFVDRVHMTRPGMRRKAAMISKALYKELGRQGGPPRHRPWKK